MAYTAKALSNAGYAVTFWGRDLGASPPTAEPTLRTASLAILPIPVTRDGVHLNAPLADTPIPLAEVVLALRPGQTVAGGTLPKAIAEAIRAKGCALYDYQTDEVFALHNALATAEGAVAMAISESPDLLAGSRCTVLGFGRIAKQLCRLLTALGAKVTVLARNASHRALAESLGYQAYPITEGAQIFPKASLIFNTIPVRLWDFSAIDLSADAKIIDLAPIYQPSQSPKLIRGAALPAKYSPAFAGRLIARCILAHLSEKEGAL